MNQKSTIALAVALTFVAILTPERVVNADSRRVSFATAFAPDPRNAIVASANAPVAFVTSRGTDTVFAIDPRSGAEVGRIAVGDGPLHVELFESGARRLLAVTCDGELGAPRNFVAVVDASDPSTLR